MSKRWEEALGTGKPKRHRGAGKGAVVDMVPQHGGPSEYGDSERYGAHDSEPVHAPDADDDREPAT